jgi:hypothetical protein
MQVSMLYALFARRVPALNLFCRSGYSVPADCRWDQPVPAFLSEISPLSPRRRSLERRTAPVCRRPNFYEPTDLAFWKARLSEPLRIVKSLGRNIS